ncbi:OmpA family protein [Enhydrobacter aerosaccus]|uniref:OmpA family protein n=1 Tax=Enhydrobacter aerosaccus TaxID=225324 RepID=A0A1T4P8C2_9HYPH|nr:OmpA family protein [Enhydrobacter aerosaccus]SJZ87476.1 OmpA family protein [Enhydrobacter aerosaccus]
MKNALLGAAALIALPLAAANAQSDWFTPGPTNPGFYIGAEGGLNWLLTSGSYQSQTGYAVGGKVGYDFVGPRLELESIYRNNQSSGYVLFPGGTAWVNGQINDLSVMANALYDFLPGAIVTPYIGAGLGIAFLDPSVSAGCTMCNTQFAYQGMIGIGFKATPNIRIDLEGRYYGTTNPNTFNNNNISLLLGVSYKFGQPEQVAPPPPAAAPSAPSFMVFFDWDRANLSQQALATIQQAADAYKTKGNARITATGHTDTSGPESYNMALSLRRANAVKDALVRDGVPATAISVVGRGESQPLVPTPDGVREPQNRRVEIVVQ